MICEDCKERPATVHYTQVINGQTTELHLCQECANRRGGGQIWANPNFLALNIFSHLAHPKAFHDPSGQQAPIEKSSQTRMQCPNCGLSYQQFLNTSILGCPNCYTAFKQQLELLIKQFQAGLRHQGKVPLRRGGTTLLGRKIQKLRNDLQKAVEQERFEQAAQLRDQLRDLERVAEQEGKKNGGAQQV